MEKTYPLLQSQLGVFMECMKNPISTQYNFPVSSILPKTIDLDRLERALQKIIQVRKELRTRFVMVDGVPRQYCDDNMEIPIPRKKMTDSEAEHYIAHDFVRPYDLLSGEPLVRIEIIEGEKNNYVLFEYQHSIGDGATMAPNLTQIDLPAAYNGEELVPNEYGMYEYALDEEEGMKSAQYEKAKQYYTEKFAGIDFVTLADSMENRLGMMVRESAFISQDTVDEWCKQQGTQSNLLFMAAFSLVLSKLTHQSEVAYYSVNHGRMDKRLRNAYGMFVKSVPILAKVSGQQPVMDFIKSFRTELMSSIRYGIYPFNHFCNEMHQEPKISFGFQGVAMQEYFDLEGEHCLPVQISKGMIDDDMSCVIYLKEGDYDIRMESSDALNSADTLLMVANCVKATVEYIMAHPDCVLSDIKMLTAKEEAHIQELSKGETLKVDDKATFPSLFIEQANKYPDANAVVDEQGTYTYAELNRLSGALALKLREMGVGSPQAHSPFVSIMLGYQKEFLVAAIGIEKAGGAYVPLDYDYPNDRLLYMLEDSESQVLVTSHAIFNEKTAQGDNFTAKNILFIEDFLKEATALSDSATESVNYATPEGIAYMIYTSGSTGKPKGVMIPHKAKANFVQFIAKEWHHTSKSRICCHSSFSFDASVEDLYPVLIVGGTLYTVPQEARKDMELLHQFIIDNGITGGCYTTQLGQMLLQQYPDLPVDYLVVGGEKMTATPECKCRLINTYGPTEFTVDATFYNIEKGKDYKNIPIGRPLYNLSAYVVDQFGHLLPQGMAGELCMAGPQIAAGYWKREDLTAQVFSNINVNGQQVKVYHTGDLVRYNADCQIEYLGRIDSQVKLRGFRIELGEIETLIGKYPGIQMECVQVREVAGVQHLCAYYTASSQIDPDALKAYLAESLTDYMVPTAYMQLDEMPLTPNGKVNTKALPQPEVKAVEMVAPETELEKKIFDIAVTLLNHDQFGVTTNLISMGLTSLTAMKLSAFIHKELGIAIPTKDILRTPVIRTLAKLSENSEQTSQLSTHEKREYYPITENQRVVYLDWEMNRDTTQYNIPQVWKMKGADASRLQQALTAVVEAHPSIKTHLEMRDGDVVQIRRDEAPVIIRMTETDTEPTVEQLQKRVLPFNLLEDDLYRIELYKYQDAVYVFVDIHHIVNDGLSVQVFLSDLQRAYGGESLQAETYTAFDYALDEEALFNSEQYQEAEKYFDDMLQGTEVTVWPHSIEDTTCEAIGIEYVDVDAAAIDAFCKENGFTQGNYFLTLFLHLLHNITRESNVMITSINNGRSDARMLDVIGMFVKTIPVVASWTEGSSKLSLREAVEKVQQQFQQTQAFDFYPFTQMVERHKVRAEIMFEYQVGIEDISDDRIEPILVMPDTAKTPLTVSVHPANQTGKYLLVARYNPTLYSKRDMQTMLSMLQTACVEGLKVKDMASIPLLSPSQTHDIITYSAGPFLDVDISKTFAKAFIECAKANPSRVAVNDLNGDHTYQELNKASDYLAHTLLKAHVEKNSFVALLLERTWFFPLSIIAVHKAGAAYTPLDIDYPVDRLQYMLENSEAKVLLTTHAELDRKCREEGLVVNKEIVNIIFLDDLFAQYDNNTPTEPIDLSEPEGYAYMIYTSGSTGKPKGVVLHQAGLWNFIESIKSIYHHSADDRIASHRAFSFVAHVEDTYAILTVGGSLHIMPSSIRKDLQQVYQFIVDHHCTGCGFTTSLAMMMIDNYQLPTRYITAGGEKLTGVVSTGHPQIINVYGPTECTDHTSVYPLETGREYKNIPVGKTLPNNWMFVVSPDGQLVPHGVAGELCFAGIQVGTGYWRLPEMSAAVFVNCPYVRQDHWGRPVRMYHTGDLVRWTDEGVLEYLGRIDNQVKVRGYRIELGEIEAVVREMENIYISAVKIIDLDGNKYISLYYTPVEGQTVTPEEVRQFIEKSSLADYMRPDYYTQLDQMPRLPNGKVDRKSLPMPEMKMEDIVAPETPLEQQIFDQTAHLLKHQNFGVTTNLVTVGLSSLVAMRLSATLLQQHDIKIPVKEILEHPTIREMAQNSKAERAEQYKPYPIRQTYPLSEAQRGILIDCLINRDALQYNIPFLLKYKTLDLERFKNALIQVGEAHPYLKARIAMEGDDYVQSRNDDDKLEIEEYTLDYEPDRAFFQSQVKPFDVLNEKLYRFKLYRTPSYFYVLLDIHHLISDGSSNYILAQEMEKAYSGQPLQKEAYTAFDRAIDEENIMKSERGAEAEQYFDKLISGAEATVYPHSTEATGNAVYGELREKIPAEAINRFCKQHALAPSSFFLTVFHHVLHRITRDESTLVYFISNGRSEVQLENFFGVFVKTMPTIVSNFNGDVVSSVKSMHQQMLNTIAHDYYPFTRMVERHGLKAEIIYNYFVDLQTNMSLGNDAVESTVLDWDTAKTPISLSILKDDDGNFVTSLEYDASLYSEADMNVLNKMIAAAAQSATTAQSMDNIVLLTTDEQKAMVDYSKGKDMDIDITKTFAQVFEERARLVPDNIAVADKNSHFTYQQLSHNSDVLAHQLVKDGVQPNDFVCVMLDRYKEFPLSVLAIHKAGAAYTPMDFEYPNERLQYMLENSESKVLITSHDVLNSKLAEGDFNTGNVKIIFIEDIDFSIPAAPINLTTPDNLAYMIYTSGSTGKPKGAMLHQAGLWNFINIVIDMEHLTADDRIEGHRSFSFDAHIEDMYPILTLGGSFHIMPSEIRKDVAAIRDFLFDHQITGGGYSTAIGALLLNTYDDLPVRFITAGGEKLSGVYSNHIEIINVYGPTECTDDTSFYSIAPGTHVENIPIGKPVANSWNFIVDPSGHLVPQGVIGELCIAGIPVGRGYWRLPERSAQSFVDCPFVSEDRWGRHVRMYHTGDLCRYNDQGDLEYVGRIDFQVKLRGFRIELGEIESKVLQIEGVLQAAAEVKKVMGTEHLVLYYTVADGFAIDDNTIRKALEESALAEYMVPDTYVLMDVMPMTPNGKINRKALPLPELKAEEIVPPSNETEQKLLDMAIELLKHDQFGVTTNLITVGLTSLSAMRLSVQIHNILGKTVPTKVLLQEPTLRQIASIIDGDEDVKDVQIARVHQLQEYYPITENQRGVYVSWELNRNTTQYNIPNLRKYKDVKAEDLRDALIEVVNAHPILKARMAMIDGDVMQQRRDHDEPVVTITALQDEPTKSFFQGRVRPFDLQNDNLYRLEIYTYGNDVYLFVDFHHIVFDGGSSMVFDRDLESILTSEQKRIVEQETYTAFDRALDEQEMRESDMYAAAEKYFDTLLESFEIASYPASRQPDKTEACPEVVSAVVSGSVVNNFCSAYGVTANSFFMTVATQVLHRLLREDDLMISTISTGRYTTEMHSTIGFFVQTLPVVTHNSNVPMREAVKSMQKQYIDTQDNSIFSYTKAVEKYGCHAEILFAFQANLGTIGEDDQQEMYESIPLQLDTVKTPIMISIFDDKDGYRIDVDYDASRYNNSDMSKFVAALKCFAEYASENADCEVVNIPLISDKEESELLSLGKGDVLHYDRNLTLVDVIRHQVAATPDATAIVFRDKQLTYRELDELTDRLAAYLQQMGVKPEQAVGVMIDRSELMAVYPIAVMKAGAAYMPLDSHFPEERLQFMCEDAGVSLILADDGIVSQAMPHYSGKVFCASELDTLKKPANKPVAAITPDNMFVILYTSGSTGKPKGCMLEHGNIVNFCHWYVKEFDVTKEDRAVAYANFGFDAHMMDLYPALSVGASVYIIPSDLRMDLMAMNKYMEEQQLTIAFMTTQIGYMFATSIENHSLRLLSVGGEKLQPLKKPRFRFYNGYGPTECTLYSTCYNITKDYNSSLIGRPLANYQLRVVDKHMNLVPRGVPGELVVMGVGVGRGYLNRPDMNAEKFITIDEQKAYRTGDLVRWSEDGNIEYIGRIDGQVKLRGLRIELGEIESRVAEHEAIKQVCVDVKEIGSVQNLVCYYVVKEGNDIEEDALKAWIGETLTAFMVPEFYVKMDKFPFTPNGKVNRRELPIPEAKEEEIVAPETETEKKLYDIAVEMLKVDKLGVTASLISYGLTSLTAMRLSALLQQRLMVAIPVAELLSHPTIREIAEYIDSNQAKSTKVADIFTKRAPQTSDGASVQKENLLQTKGNPLQAKGNPLQAKGNPFAPKKNPLQSNNNNKK